MTLSPFGTFCECTTVLIALLLRCLSKARYGKTTTTKKTTTTSTTNEVAALKAQVTTLEKKLQNLITVLHAELTTEMLQGPRGTARKLEEAGLTE